MQVRLIHCGKAMTESIIQKDGFVMIGPERIRMKIEIFWEPMTAENIEETAEAMSAIIVRHLITNNKQAASEQKQIDKKNKA